jgi:hypothetical protein
MKQKEVSYNGEKYIIHAMGFFKSNRILLDKILPLTPIIFKAAQENSQTENKDSDSKERLTDILSQVITSINSDLFESITKEILHDVRKENGDAVVLDGIDDYELYVELMKAAFSLNYSSLGKFLARLKKLTPKETLKAQDQ